MSALLLLLAACGPDAPDPCVAMCATAAALYEGCLADDGQGWAAAGYADEADFVASCETWAWEMRQIEAERGDEGVIDAACVDREASLDTCEAFFAVDWSAYPAAAQKVTYQ